MTKFIGRRGVLGLAKESSRGTPVEPTVWLGRNTISFDDKVETARNVQGLGRVEDSDGNHVTNKHGSGEFEMDMEDTALGLILTSLLGASPSTAGGGSPYTHTYTLQNTNQPQSLTLAYQDPDTTKLFPLTVVDSLNISVTPNGIVTASIGFMSQGAREWTSLSEDMTGLGQKFLHQFLRFKLADAVGNLSGASEISLKSLDLTISRNTIKDDVLGTVQPEDILGQQVSFEGSLSLNKEDETYRNYMLDGTYRAMEVFLQRSSSSSLQLQSPRVDFTEWEQDRSLDEIVTQAINFKGNYDAANDSAVISTCKLINSDDGSNY